MTRGAPVPDDLIQPQVTTEEGKLLDAWMSLSGDRQISLGVGPIPFTSIDRYAARFGIDDQLAFRFFHRAIKALDAVYIGYVAKKRD